MEYISLGSNCSITYQLNKYGLRKNSYPFDWTKISLSKLINVFEENFDDFVESLEFKKISHNHLVLEEIDKSSSDDDNILSSSSSSSSLILTNKYKIEFAHELVCIEQIEKFKEKLNTRIIRFREVLTNSDVIKIFLRIELSNITKSYYLEINKLIDWIETNTTNYKLVLIVNTTENFNFNPEKVHVYKFQEFSSDWKMDSLDWLQILNILHN